MLLFLTLPVLGVTLAGPAAATDCPSGKAAVTNVSYVINGTTTVTTILGKLHSGDTVQVKFTIAPGCYGIRVSLASYRAPAPTYDRNTANQQVLFDSATGKFNAGRYSLTIVVPAGFYQVDFVLGTVITQLGPANSNNFYGDQNRLIDHDNGGTVPDHTVPEVPVCKLTATIDGPPKQIQVTVQYSGFGLSTVVVSTLTNATATIAPFTPGTAQAVIVTATKIDQTLGSYVGVVLTNMAGDRFDCDPPF